MNKLVFEILISTEGGPLRVLGKNRMQSQKPKRLDLENVAALLFLWSQVPLKKIVMEYVAQYSP